MKERDGQSFDIFWMNENETKNNTWNFIIYPELDGHVSLPADDSIGKVPAPRFPNQYLIKNDRLFIWNDSTTPLRKDILNVLDEFGVLDSTDIKKELGTLPSDFQDTRMVTIDHRLNNGHYIVCKNNVGKYKKKFTNRSHKFYEKMKSGRLCQ